MKLFKLLVAIILVVPGSALSQSKAELKHEKLLSSTKFLTVQFSQTIYKKLRNRSTTRKGTAYFAKPNKFRWNFDKTKKGIEEYYYNGKMLTHYQSKVNEVTHYSTNKGLSRDLNQVINLVLDPKVLLDSFSIIENKTIKTTTTFTLKPKNELSSDIHLIKVKISDTRKYVKEVKIQYDDENYTLFKFKNPKKAVIDDNIFTFSKKGNFKIRYYG